MPSSNSTDAARNPATLRSFGIMFAAVISALFGLLFPWLTERPVPYWPWVVAALFLLLATLVPLRLGPVYRGWLAFGAGMNRITTPIILGIVFFGVLTPFGMIRRLLGKDSLERSFDGSSASYRKVRESVRNDMENPY